MLRELDLGEFEFGGINITGIQPISAARNETDSTSKLKVCSLTAHVHNLINALIEK